jgi:hypothetical protein
VIQVGAEELVHGVVLQHDRVDVAGMDGVDPDGQGRKLQGQVVDQARDGSFGIGVSGGAESGFFHRAGHQGGHPAGNASGCRLSGQETRTVTTRVGPGASHHA